MASLLQAINQYGPKLEQKPTVQIEKVAEWMAMRTGLNKSEVLMVLQEMSEAILNFNKDGAPVKLPGIGIFTPSMDREGVFSINFRADMALKNGLNAPGAYSGGITNKARIRMSNEDLKDLWDADHPDDPLNV